MSLPQHKIDQLSERVAEDLGKVIEKHHRDLKEHEVNHSDREQILTDGWSKVGRRPFPRD
jgi:hypothetical protein